MKVLPKTTEAWVRAALLPFKVYVLLTFIAMHFYMDFLLPRKRDYECEVFGEAILGYAVCFTALFVGGVCQAGAGRRKEATITFLLAALAIICGRALLPYTAHT